MRVPLALVLVGLAVAACLPPADVENDDAELAALVYADAGIPDRPDAPEEEEEVTVCIPIAALPAEALPRCTAATRDCVDACPAEGGDACRDACWASDPTPPLGATGCKDCVFVQLLSCIDVGGCHTQVADFMCCLSDTALVGPCDNEAQSMFGCGFGSSPACFDVIGGDVGRCYAASDPVGEGEGEGE